MNHISEFILLNGDRVCLNLDNVRNGELNGDATVLFLKDTMEKVEVREPLAEVVSLSCGFFHLIPVKSVSKQVPKDVDMVINQKFIRQVSRDVKTGNGVLEMMSPSENYLTALTYGQVCSMVTMCAIVMGSSGLPLSTKIFNSDALAAVGLIGLGEPYWAGPAHIEGAIEGTLKLRVA